MAPKSTKCLSCLFDATLSLRGPANGTRVFSSTERQLFRKRVVHRKPGNAEEAALRSSLKGYNPLEKKLLKYKYNEEQMRALAAGEEAVDTKDLLQQGRFRTDPMRLEYIDDFATLRPSVDYPVDSESKPRNIQKKADEEGNYKNAQERRMAEARKDAGLVRLSQQTGMSLDEIQKLRTKVLVTHRVVNQTRMGKIQSLYFLSVAGNGRGMVGIGEGKAAEDEDGRRQARMNAIRNMKPVPRYENRTIYGEVEAKVGASIVQLSARPPGFGNRCQSLIYELARAAGIQDLSARTPRSRNKMNVVKAAFTALTNQRLPEEVALARGRKMVDVRGVYYGGLVQ